MNDVCSCETHSHYAAPNTSNVSVKHNCNLQSNKRYKRRMMEPGIKGKVVSVPKHHTMETYLLHN